MGSIDPINAGNHMQTVELVCPWGSGVAEGRGGASELSLNSQRASAPKNTLASLLPSFGLEEEGGLAELHI